jgi:hypothetical protein
MRAAAADAAAAAALGGGRPAKRKAALAVKDKLAMLRTGIEPGGELSAPDVSDSAFCKKLSSLLTKSSESMKAAMALLPSCKSQLLFAQRTEDITARLRQRWASGPGSAAGDAAGASAAAALARETEDSDLQCCICLDIPESEFSAAVAPCGHLFHTNCIAGWIVSKQNVYGAPVELPSGSESENLLEKLKSSFRAPCPTCKVDFAVSGVHTVSESAAGCSAGGMGSEVEIVTLAEALTRLSSRGTAGAAGAAGASAAAAAAAAAAGGGGSGSGSGSGSSSAATAAGSAAAELPSGVASSEQANSVALKDAAESSAQQGKRSAAAASSKRKAGSSSLELYGGKLACLVRRLRLLPPGEKAVVATSWPHLRTIISEVLSQEGISNVVVSGSPAEIAHAVARFMHGGGRGTGGSSSSSSSSGSGSSAALALPPLPAARQKAVSQGLAAGQPLAAADILVLGLNTDCAGLTLTAANPLFVMDPVLSPVVMVREERPTLWPTESTAPAPTLSHSPPSLLSLCVQAQTIGRIARQGQTKPCIIYHFVVQDSVEERMVLLRCRLATEGSMVRVASASSLSKGQRADMRNAKVDDANASSTDRLTLGNLLELLRPEGTEQDGEGSGSGSAEADIELLE